RPLLQPGPPENNVTSVATTRRPVASADLHRHEDLLAVALDEQRDALRLAGDDAPDLLDRLHRLAVDRQEHVARLDAGTRRGARDVLDDEAGVDLGLALLLARQRPEREPELAAATVAGLGDDLLGR